MNRILVLFLLYGSLAMSQNPALNNQKYWFYRYRLTKQFMKIGLKDCGSPGGYSIPAGTAFTKSGSTEIHFGDGTSFLGYYIGVLATEYQLLVNSGQSTDRTLDELYKAMMAYERVDRNAEALMAPISSSNCANNLNGFFLRDDVPSDFYKEINAASPLGNLTSYNVLNSDFNYGILNGTASNINGSPNRFPSQDQVANLLIGFALVTKIFPSTVVWNGYNFKGKAQQYTDLMLSYLRNRSWLILHPSSPITNYVNPNVVQNWMDCFGSQISNIVSNPSSFNPASCIGPVPTSTGLIEFGSEMLPNAYGFAKAGEKIYHDQWGGHAVDIGSNLLNDPWNGTYSGGVIGLNSYKFWNNVYGYPAGLAFFGFNYNDDFASSHTYANGYIASTAAIGNSWEVGLTSYPLTQIKFQIPWICTSAGLSDPVCLLHVFGGCVLSVQYPIINVWNCPIDQEIDIYCYQNNLGTLLTNFATSELPGILPGLGKFSAYVLNVLNTFGMDLSLCAPFQLPNVAYNTTSIGLSEYGKQYGTELYPFLHHYLHDSGPYTIGNSSIQSILNSAPCNGPYYRPYNDPLVNANGMGGYGVGGWQWDNRFERGGKTNIKTTDNGSYSGLDYMLLYNLQALINNDNNGGLSYVDLRTNTVKNEIFPLAGSTTYEGSDQNPNRTTGFETLTADYITVNAGKTVSTNGNAVFHASEQIALTNFSAYEGCYFEAQLTPAFPCNNAGGVQYREEEDRDSADDSSTLDSAQITQMIKNELAKGIAQYYQTEQAKKTMYEPLADYLARNQPTASADQATSSLAYSFEAYPNPVLMGARVNMMVNTNQAMKAKCTVMDNLGQTLFATDVLSLEEGQNNVELTINFKEEGVYFVQLATENGKQTKKIVVLENNK